MTLINYLTRVHFADGVVEEALHSELDHHAKRRPLVIAEADHLTGTAAERIFSSFPARMPVETFSSVTHQATEAAALSIARIYQEGGCDLLIAFGSNRAMDLAKVARVAIAYEEPVAELSSELGGEKRITNALPDLYSIPGILGFASAISDYTRVRLDDGSQVLLSSRHLIPDVTICDPTLTLGASQADTALAAAGILARGVDAFLAPVFNPPADAMALDSVRRTVENIDRALDDDLDGRREMMASGLNSSLALQKGLCIIHAIANAIASSANVPIDPSTLGSILIPHLARDYERRGASRLAALKQCLGVGEHDPLGDALDRIMDRFPLAATLAGIGVSELDLERVAVLAVRDRAINNGPVDFTDRDVRSILMAAYGPVEMASASHG